MELGQQPEVEVEADKNTILILTCIEYSARARFSTPHITSYNEILSFLKMSKEDYPVFCSTRTPNNVLFRIPQFKSAVLQTSCRKLKRDLASIKPDPKK